MAKKKKRAGGRESGREKERSDEPLAAGEAVAEAAHVTADLPVASTTRPVVATDARPRRRSLENAFIACFLLFMLAMPLRYYLGGRGFDERFSWRMFSTIRMLDCKVKVQDVLGGAGRTREVPLVKEVQVAWIGMLERARGLVVQKLLERRCDEAGVTLARYHLECTSPDGSTLPDVDRHMVCKIRELADGRGEP